MSALGCQRALGLGSYETSWTWLHKLRRAMVRPGRDRLAGEIEADETYVGGREEGKRGRAVESKAIVAVVAEQRGPASGASAFGASRTPAKSLLAFLQEAVEPGAKIRTDGWRGYAGLPAAGYRHQVTVISGGSELAHEVMPRVHKVAALLKRWLLGTLQGGIQHQHLDDCSPRSFGWSRTTSPGTMSAAACGSLRISCRRLSRSPCGMPGTAASHRPFPTARRQPHSLGSKNRSASGAGGYMRGKQPYPETTRPVPGRCLGSQRPPPDVLRPSSIYNISRSWGHEGDTHFLLLASAGDRGRQGDPCRLDPPPSFGAAGGIEDEIEQRHELAERIW